MMLALQITVGYEKVCFRTLITTNLQKLYNLAIASTVYLVEINENIYI